jgi:hypothetical protein
MGGSAVLLLILAFVAACDPGTTRPDLLPMPEARTLEVEADRPTAIEALHAMLVADSFPVRRVVARDAWLETDWFSAATLRPAGDGALGPHVMKLRGWVEPSRVGESVVVVELVYRPLADPSLPPRELERSVPATDSMYARVERLLQRLQDSIGAHRDGAPPAR